MELVNYRITLDVLKNGVQKTLQGFNTGDAYARRIEVSLVRGSELFELTDNLVASMYVKHEDAEEPSINACEIIGNKVIYNILPTDISSEGIVSMQLKIIEVKDDISKVLVSPRFELAVWDAITDDSEAEKTTVYTALEEALAEAKRFKDKTVVSVIVDEDYLFIVTFGDGSQYTSTVIQDAMKDISSVAEYVEEAKEAAETATSAEAVATEKATEAVAAKQYIIDHREELKGEPGVIWKTEEPTLPEERVPIWINPNGQFVPIPIGPGGGADIDDDVVATDKTWSSSKINSLISEFVTPTNVKTINGESIIGKGNIVVSGGESDVIPSYYNEEYATTKAKVEELSINDSCFNILCATDLHYSPKGSGYNEDKLRAPIFNMLKALHKAEREMPLSLVATFGDYMQMPSGYTKEQGISNIAELNAELSSINTPKMAIAGNHETHYNGNSDGIGLTNDEIYNLLLKKYVGRDIKKASENVFYAFDDANEVCYLFISAESSSKPFTYIQSAFDKVISANTNNYPYMVFCHFAVDTDNNTVWSGVSNSIDYIKTTKGKEIIAWIGGHKHCDWVVNYNNTLVVTLINSCWYAPRVGQDGVQYDKELGTSNESAFSIITINKVLGKLFITRFGAGVDIECNYNNTSGAIGRVDGQPTYDDWFDIANANVAQNSGNRCEYSVVGNNLTVSMSKPSSGIVASMPIKELPTITKKTFKVVADSGVATDKLMGMGIEFVKDGATVTQVGILGSAFTVTSNDIINGGITRTVTASTIEQMSGADTIRVYFRTPSAGTSGETYNFVFNNLRIELS